MFGHLLLSAHLLHMMENIDDVANSPRRFLNLWCQAYTAHRRRLHAMADEWFGEEKPLEQYLGRSHSHLMDEIISQLIQIITSMRQLHTARPSSLTWGSFSNSPAVCISSQPRILRFISVSLSRPSWLDGVSSNFASGIRQFSNVRIILLNVFGSAVFCVIFAEENSSGNFCW